MNSIKSLMLAMAAIACIACTEKITVSDGGSADRAISLAPVTSVSTKAAIDGTTFPDGRTMVVSAYYNATTGDSKNYFCGSTFSKSGSTWVGDKYWPLSGNLDLLAYSVDGLDIDASKSAQVSYDTDWSEGVTLTVPDNRTIQTDILWSAASAQVYSATGNPMVFDHAEALVVFTAKTNVARNTTTNHGITIEKITLKNAKYSGTVYLKADGTCEWSSLGSKNDKDLPSLADYVVPTTAMDISTAGNHMGLGGYGIILPPQEATSFIIHYTMHNGKDAGGNNVDNEHLQYEYTCSGDWVEGKKYLYAINITLHKIEVVPSIVDWVTETSEPTLY